MYKKWMKCLLVGGCLLTACKPSYEDVVSTQYADLKLDSKGFVRELIDNRTGKNYMLDRSGSPLLELYDGQQYFRPTGLKAETDRWILTFSNGSEAVVTKETKDGYIRCSLQSLSHREGIQAIAWGPYATTIQQYIGETVGVVHDSVFAVGVQTLDLFTTEGRPDAGDDAVLSVFIDPLPGQQLPDSLKDQQGKQLAFINVNETGDMPDYVRQWRGSAAIKTPQGSELHFFARDWRQPRTVELYGRKQQVEPIDQDFIGSSIAFFAVPSSEVLNTIEKIEVAEGLPHPSLNGEWIKRQELNQAYMLYEGSSLDRALDYADSCNFSLVHIGDIFKSWGHFDLHTARFPQGAEQIKAFTEKAHARGKTIGVHTLTMFTSQHDPYITPVPNDSLCIAGSSVLTQAIQPTDREIAVESPDFFRFADKTHTVKIGQELISYRTVSDEAPFRLLDCTRGQFGTRPTAHQEGDKVDKLVNDDYSGFFPDIYLQDRYADRLAEVCKETGIDLMDFDGYGGGSPTGHGCLGAGMFIDRWYKNLDHYRLTCGAGTFHYYWHIYSFMNWGEPWYDNLRQSQVNYRLENQRYFERNFMPGMLGWFKLEQTYRPDDIEWIQARSAAFNAGYLLRVDESIEKNGFKSQLFEAIREWQHVRRLHVLTAEQRERMKDPKREFHLEKTGDDCWNLYEIILKSGFQLKYRSVQTGEPLVNKYTFENPFQTQAIRFYATVLPGEDANATLQNVKLQVEGCAPVEIPATLKAGDKIYSDGQLLRVCDSFWKERACYELPKTALWNQGTNKVTLQCDFSSPQAPSVSFEFKAVGDAEIIRK